METKYFTNPQDVCEFAATVNIQFITESDNGHGSRWTVFYTEK